VRRRGVQCRQAGTGLSDRTHHWKDTRERSHSQIESRAKSTDANLTNAPDGTPAHSQFVNVPRRQGDTGGSRSDSRTALRPKVA
jgi:hypothetical protein